jgi:hypothetical protein
MNNKEARAILQPIADQLHLMFEEEKASGAIPDNYKSIGQLIDKYEELLSSGVNLKQAREAIGVTSKRLLFESNAKGKVKVNTRHAAELIPKTILKWIRESESVGALPPNSEKAYITDVLRGWGDSDARTRELTNISATNWQNGHFQGAQPENKPPGPTSGRNAHPEIQPNYIGQDALLKRGNSSHGSDPRANLTPRQMEDWAIPQTWWDDVTQFFTGTGTNLGRGPTQQEALRMDAGANPDQLLAQADRSQQLGQQTTPGVSTADTTARAGPLKILKQGVTDGATRVNPDSGRPEIFDKAKGKWRSQVVDLGSAAPTLPNKIPAIGKAAAVLGGVPILFDAADAFAGTQGAVQANTPGQRLASGLQAVSGYTGLASLNPGFAPVTGPVSLATGALSAAVQRREDMNKPPVRHTYTGPTPQIIPTPIPRSKPIGNGQGGITKPKGASTKSGQPLLSQNNLKWALKQLGFLR